MRKLPGTESASYQISTFLFPSLSMLVVFCTKVAVLYQDFAYFFCIPATKSAFVLILALLYDSGAINNVTDSKSENRRMSNPRPRTPKVIDRISFELYTSALVRST